MRYFLCILTILAYLKGYGQQDRIILLDSGRNVSIRGLSVVSDEVIWCSGSNGSVARSTDGGKTFTWLTVPGYEKRDFRDIEAFSDQAALIMGIGEPAVILKTTDGGNSWRKVFEDTTKGMFLDAMHFDDQGNGCVVGDPIEGRLFEAFTTDYGDTWQSQKQILMKEGEAFFASSGTNIHRLKQEKGAYVLVSGGLASRLFYKGRDYLLPMGGKESSGANSIACSGNKAVIVGGDYKNDKDTNGNCVLVNMKKDISFSEPAKRPSGYRSCAIFYDRHSLIACGTSGVDLSWDGGRHWYNLSAQNFHVVQKARSGNAVYMAGGKGKIARFIPAKK